MNTIVKCPKCGKPVQITLANMIYNKSLKDMARELCGCTKKEKK